MKEKAEVAASQVVPLEESNDLLESGRLGMLETPEEAAERLEYVRLIRNQKLHKICARMTDSDSILTGNIDSSAPPKDDRNSC